MSNRWRFRHLSIRWKLTILAMITTSVAVILMSAGRMAYAYWSMRKQMAGELEAQAQLIAENSNAALSFGSASDATSTLHTLSSQRHVQAACLYTANGDILAQYKAMGFAGLLPESASRPKTWFGRDSLECFYPVTLDGRTVGTLYVRSDLGQLYDDLPFDSFVSLLLATFAAAASFVLVNHLQRFISEPIAQLLGISRRISRDKDYSLRATKQSDDDLGTLIDAFNEMLSEIQVRDGDLQRARFDAETANHTKSDFLAKMSHEIRTPLNGLTGTIQLLMGTKLDSQQRRFAQLAQASGDALLTVINDILDFSKIEAGKMELENVDVNPLLVVEAALDILGPKALGKGLELASFCDPKVCRVLRGDPDRLRQIIINLVNNAIKFTEKGSVVIRVTLVEETSSHLMLRFAVMDTGIGIPSDRLDRLFKSFSQVDSSTTRKHGGTGLGLVISKQLTEMMGGQIGVESKPGTGTTFWFTVRLEQHVQAQHAPPQPAFVRGMKVLIVTSSPEHASVLQDQLASWQMDGHHACDERAAEGALQGALAERNPFKLVIHDITRDVDPCALAARIAHSPQFAKTVTMVLVSLEHRISPTALAKGRIAGAITKPVHQSQLLDSIMDALAKASGEKRQEAHPSRENPTIQSRPALKGAHILVAEDNEVNQVVVTAMLEQIGCTYEVVGDGRAAAERALSGEFDLVLMDCHMPVMDGFEATARIREAEGTGSSHIPIVALTANAVKGDREQCLAAGMDGYVSKPIGVPALINTMDGLLSKTRKAISPLAESRETSEPDPTTVAPIDVGGILERCMNNAKVVEKILQKFREQVPGTMEALRKSIATADRTEITRLAHSVKGASANISAEMLRQVAFVLEQSAGAASLDEALRQFSAIEAELKRCVDFIPDAILQAHGVAIPLDANSSRF